MNRQSTGNEKKRRRSDIQGIFQYVWKDRITEIALLFSAPDLKRKEKTTPCHSGEECLKTFCGEKKNRENIRKFCQKSGKTRNTVCAILRTRNREKVDATKSGGKPGTRNASVLLCTYGAAAMTDGEETESERVFAVLQARWIMAGTRNAARR